MTAFQEEQSRRLFWHYMQGVDAYLGGGSPTPWQDKHLWRVEAILDIPEQGVDDFRRMIMAYFGSLSVRGIPWTWDANIRLKQGIEQYLSKYADEVVPEPLEIDAHQASTRKYRSIDDL